ncbi:hypothetical protein N658DRAFT_491569 [Parathielavia hyrcaniae]|uniref:Uncharacterized protein n=1 Tax=Parathielavia hyrcaniae TaxID=113614 RepID=A0AAN6T6G4_9PEZI|nr:hypothetical protein N658DRAFT_491569 [Parathielavia hyrcaniae]
MHGFEVDSLTTPTIGVSCGPTTGILVRVGLRPRCLAFSGSRGFLPQRPVREKLLTAYSLLGFVVTVALLQACVKVPPPPGKWVVACS